MHTVPADRSITLYAFQKGPFNMKRTGIITAAAILCLIIGLIPCASAETFTFNDFGASLSLPSGVYSKVITKENYAQNADYLISQGYDMDYVTADFEEEGLYLMAFDTKNGRRFILTAVQDANAKNYFDLNEQNDDMRKDFRTSHTDGTAYGLLGYNYSSAQWKNYGGNVMRFLQTRYTLTRDGVQVWQGAQRRTIRNGYTITLDMQTPGRKVTDADVKALETIMKTFDFIRILPVPELPIKLVISSEPPAETHSDTFTLKGKTLAKAKATVSVISTSGTQAGSYTAEANGSGNFSVKIKLPSRGNYVVTVTVQREGSMDATRTYSVSYDPHRIIATMSRVPGDILEGKTVIKGTSEGGVQVQLIVTGPVEYVKSTTNKNFSFTVDTSAEGDYTFRLVMSKKGFNERTFEYTGTRSLTAEERLRQLKSSAIHPEYSRLTANAESYNGQLFVYSGYLLECRQGDGSYLYTIALSKSGSSYKNVVYLNSEVPLSVSVGQQIRFYGTKTGDIVVANGDKTVSVPKFDLLFLE
ncbi:MAG: hypothetical protein CW338_02965 [Clostridiales bacterium]|nr:hypothetical protein [Clostridiales bacterium]